MRAIEERFWPKVTKADGNACWEWRAGRRRGYGRIALGPRGMGDTGAHRVSWQLSRGIEPPPQLDVLHRCDNPRCVRPDHLFLGTQADNHADMVAKGRQATGARIIDRRRTASGERHGSRLHPEKLARGERVGTARLTADEVVEIRARAARGESQRSLARAFGVSQGNIGFIVRREWWRHI